MIDDHQQQFKSKEEKKGKKGNKKKYLINVATMGRGLNKGIQ